MERNFGDKLIEAIKAKGNPICVGLDPRLDKVPAFIKKEVLAGGDITPMRAAAESILEFNKGIIDEISDIVPVVKPQIAFYELFGHDGIWAFQETLKYCKEKGILTIADAKRGDIGSTAEAYSRAFLGEIELFEGEDEVIMPAFDADSLTVNAYLGWDGVKPFVEECRRYGKGIFVLVKTSNPSSGDLQDLELHEGGTVYELMGQLMDSWGSDEVGESGYSFVGAVVGATYPNQAAKLRRLMPNNIFLVPGYGAQGGSAEDVLPCFNSDGLGAVVNNSRGIIFAHERMNEFSEKDYAKAARQACIEMKADLDRVLGT